MIKNQVIVELKALESVHLMAQDKRVSLLINSPQKDARLTYKNY